MSNSILTIAECRNEATHFLEKNNLNMFLINEYLKNDKSGTVNFRQYNLCRNIMFDSIYKESLYYQDANRSAHWFRCIEDQVYKLIKQDERYREDAVHVHMVLGGAVSGLTGFLMENFSIDAAAAVGISYFLIYTIARIGLRAWCQKYEEDRNIDNGDKKK